MYIAATNPNYWTIIAFGFILSPVCCLHVCFTTSKGKLTCTCSFFVNKMTSMKIQRKRLLKIKLRTFNCLCEKGKYFQYYTYIRSYIYRDKLIMYIIISSGSTILYYSILYNVLLPMFEEMQTA